MGMLDDVIELDASADDEAEYIDDVALIEAWEI